MSKKIEEIIARREDLGTFLIHLTSQQNDPKSALCSIIKKGEIEARNSISFWMDFKGQGHSQSILCVDILSVEQKRETPHFS